MLSLGWGTITRPLRVSCCLPWLPTSRPLPRLLGRAFVMYTDRMFCFCFCLFVSFTTPQVPRVFPPAPPTHTKGGGHTHGPTGPRGSPLPTAAQRPWRGVAQQPRLRGCGGRRSLGEKGTLFPQKGCF